MVIRKISAEFRPPELQGSFGGIFLFFFYFNAQNLLLPEEMC
jgi:hypothetical protein